MVSSMDRRSFLKLGVASSAVLTGVSVTATMTGCSDSTPLDGDWKVLRPSDRRFLAAVAPVMLKGALPTDVTVQSQVVSTMLVQMDRTVFGLGPHNQKQLIDLFNLLNFSVSRGLTTGVWSAWENASDADIEHFLTKWRNSSIGLFNLAYNGLNRLMCAAWFGQPDSWQTVGYPGPPFADILITK